MDAAGVDFGLLCAWSAPAGAADLQRRGRRLGARAPGPASPASPRVDLDRPMEARARAAPVRHRARLQGPAGHAVAVGGAADRPPLLPAYAACVELGVPFCTQVGHTGPLRPSETGRPIPYIDQVAIDFPELVIVCGHVGYPWTEEMVAVCRKHANVHRHLRLHDAALPPELVAFLRTGTGRRKVLFGTNYPMIRPVRRSTGSTSSASTMRRAALPRGQRRAAVEPGHCCLNALATRRS